MSFHTKQYICPIRPNITFQNMDIAYTSESTFFGIHITKNLKWMAHVHSLSLQLSKVPYLIKSFKEIMSSCMIRNIYHSKFQSLLRYGTIFGEGR